MRGLVDWILAALPIISILVLMLRYRWGGAEAGAFGWFVAQVIAVAWYGTNLSTLWYAQVKGVLLALYVLYIIWAALLFYRVTAEAGAVNVVGGELPRFAPSRGYQALLLGWIFSGFLQGVGGFGVPVAVIAPLLATLGFDPVTAVVIPSIGHGWAVSFGSLGAGFFAMSAATGIASVVIAPWAALLAASSCVCCGIAVLWAAGGRKLLAENALPMVLLAAVMSAVQFWVVTHGFVPIGSMIASVVGLGAALTLAHVQRQAIARRVALTGSVSGLPEGDPNACPVVPPTGPAPKRMSLSLALVPYVLLIAVILVAELIEPVGEFLDQVMIRINFPEMMTARGWVTPAGAGRTISVFGHAGALLIYASLLSYALYYVRSYYGPGTAKKIANGVVSRATRSSLGILTMVCMASTMDHAGMTYLLAEGIARVSGASFPLISPFIGALGAFMTGSNTNSNVVFSALQQNIATLLHISVPVILGAQTAGGSLGSMFAPAKIIVGCSTVDVKGGEGEVLRAVMRYGLMIVGVAALATVLLIYVFRV